MLNALIELEPYLDRLSQPGDRWAALCVRSAINEATGRKTA